MMLGGVPIRVISPPRIEPKESGMRSRAAERLALAADCRATGIIRARAPTLFMKADSTAATPDKAATCPWGEAAAGVTARRTKSTAPEAVRARLITSTAATVITAGWPKPAKASPAGTSPAATAAKRASMATMS